MRTFRAPPAPTSGRSEKLNGRQTGVYRAYNDEGVLLYVGISIVVPSRLRQHAKGSEWWWQCEEVEVEWFDDRYLAEDAEIVAIWQEQPIYNRDRPMERKHRPRKDARAEDLTPLAAALDALPITRRDR